MIISMIFDLATLVIAFMAFNTPAAQQSQVTIYNLPNCTEANGGNATTYLSNWVGTAENKCDAMCLVIEPQNNTVLYFSIIDKDITCYFNDSNGCASGEFFNLLRMNQSMNAPTCQPLFLSINPQNHTRNLSMSCFGSC